MSGSKNGSPQTKHLAALMKSVCSHSADLESGLKKQNGWAALAAFEDLAAMTHETLHPTGDLSKKSGEPVQDARVSPNAATQMQEPTRASRIVGHPTSRVSLPQNPITQVMQPTGSDQPSVSAPAPQYATRKNEYAPALNQNDLVQALLRYQNQRGSRSKINPGGRSQNPATPRNHANSGTPAQSNPTEFSPMQVPFVSAEPKDSRLTSNRNAGVRIPILRPKPENRNGGN